MHTRWCSRVGGLVLAVVSASILADVILVRPAHAAEGFGAATRGGQGIAGGPGDDLNHSGPGSLREALSAGNRTVTFGVGGAIVLADPLFVRGPFVTIDGSTAPAGDHPGGPGSGHPRRPRGAQRDRSPPAHPERDPG